MIMPEFCKDDAKEAIQDLRVLLTAAPTNICFAYIARIKRVFAFLEAARDAAPVIPRRQGVDTNER
jgi:hypothetical protein